VIKEGCLIGWNNLFKVRRQTRAKEKFKPSRADTGYQKAESAKPQGNQEEE
jgi:hypothetical protein